MSKTILVTGGAGFIGSAVVRHLINDTDHTVVNLDKLTYAGNLESLTPVSDSDRYSFEQVDICDAEEVKRVFNTHQPDIIMHLAAESHVDRSIDGPGEFIQTNVVGTYTLLEQARAYWSALEGDKKSGFKFHHISTDEVYGDLPHPDEFKPGTELPLFTETTPYAPSSPYSASKASSDQLVRSWLRTYKLPTLVTNCSNNYGPYQYPEKLIPLMITNSLESQPLPVYGRGVNVRDWIHVTDHCRALLAALDNGKPGRVYNFGGASEETNLHVVQMILANLKQPESLIRFVSDRPGHDLRYAMDFRRARAELGWRPEIKFEQGLRDTVAWYVENREWWEEIKSGAFQRYYANQYDARLKDL